MAPLMIMHYSKIESLHKWNEKIQQGTRKKRSARADMTEGNWR